MIDYIKGEITELGPAEMTLENNGIGYKILISLPSISITIFGKTKNCITDSGQRMKGNSSAC